MNVEHEIIRSQAKEMSDERLEKELAFAEGFAIGTRTEVPQILERNADVWLAALREEQEARKGNEHGTR